jgi:uncharacterized protein YlxP (DUF503 family)
MIVAACQIRLRLYGVNSLKDKRSVIKSLLARLPRHFNVAVAEVEENDSWQTAVIALVAVGNEASHLHALLEKAVAWVANYRPDAQLERYTIELR